MRGTRPPSWRRPEPRWQASAGTVEQAARAYQIAELRYREGLSTQTELLDSRIQLQQAQASRARAARDLQVAKVRIVLLPALAAGGDRRAPRRADRQPARPSAPSTTSTPVYRAAAPRDRWRATSRNQPTGSGRSMMRTAVAIRRGVPGAVLAVVGARSGRARGSEADTGMAVADPVVLVGAENIAVAQLDRAAERTDHLRLAGAAKTEARVRAEIGGPVKRTFADEGQRVRRGVLLARLDDTAVRDAYLSAKSAVRTAEVRVQNAQRNAERSTRLAQAGALPERDLETAQLNATNAEGALADARARLARPRSSSATRRFARRSAARSASGRSMPGDVVQVGSRAVHHRRSQQPAAGGHGTGRGDRPSQGRACRWSSTSAATTGASPGGSSGSIPAVDPATRQVRIYVAIPNAEQSLVAGLYAEGRVATDARRAVAVPISAVDRRGTEPVHPPRSRAARSKCCRCGWECAMRPSSWSRFSPA